MIRDHFTTSLAPANARIYGGFGAGCGIDPCKVADQVFKGVVPGPWLCCYMLRRFGWPDTGSDDYKELCAWTLTTPMPGLYLGVAPYLGNGMNLSFSVRFNRDVQKRISANPVRYRFIDRKRKAIMRWWREKGCKLYMCGTGKKVGDEDELIEVFAERGDEVTGLWKREARHAKTHPRTIPRYWEMVDWWLGEFIKKKHPEVRLPKAPKHRSRRTRFQIAVHAALRATMRDLLRPTSIRSLSFSVFGDIERTPEAIERHAALRLPEANRWPGAGYAPAYWFSDENAKVRRAAEKEMGVRR